jgi:hypothetical protein
LEEIIIDFKENINFSFPSDYINYEDGYLCFNLENLGKEKENKNYIGVILNNIGLIYNSIDKNDISLKYFYKTLNLFKLNETDSQ